MTKFELGNTKLRAMEPSDIGFLLQCENDTEHWQVSATKFPFSEHILKKFIEVGTNLEQDGQLRFIISLLSGEPIGTLDLFEYDSVNKRAGIGILVDKAYRGNGHAGEALKIAIDYSFNVLHLNQLHASILHNNTVSKNLFESFDFVQCGFREKWVKTSSGWLNEYLYQLINRNS
jgi:diamine N-acetyltransferase